MEERWHSRERESEVLFLQLDLLFSGLSTVSTIMLVQTFCLKIPTTSIVGRLWYPYVCPLKVMY